MASVVLEESLSGPSELRFWASVSLFYSQLCRWHISILDNRSAEDHGTDPTFNEQFYDTKLPLNVNDEDIYPEMKEPPKERDGATEMTFCLIRFELSVFNRRLNCTNPGAAAAEQTLEEKEKMIDACHRKIEEKYLKYCDMTLPICKPGGCLGS